MRAYYDRRAAYSVRTKAAKPYQDRRMTSEKQEIKNQTIGAAVTPSEKRYAELAATISGRPLSQLVRERIEDLIEQGKRAADAVEQMRGSAA